MVTLIQSHHSLSDTMALRCSLSVCILCVSLSELLLGVVAPRSGSCSVCILCVSLSELLLGVVAPRSGSFSVCILCVSLSEESLLHPQVLLGLAYMYAMYLLWYMYRTIQCRTINKVSYSIKGKNVIG